jgi:hypothetical protein
LFFEKPNKINKPLANLTKMRKEKTKINKTRNEKGEIRKHTKKSRESSGNTLRTYIQILENLEEMKKFLDPYDHLKLNQEGISHPN